jgi:hypothetical protein
MKSIQEAARSIPVSAEVDILIAGAGPAGIGAAIGAAKAGNQQVMLIEKCNSLGGMATSGMMSHWVGVTGSPEIATIQERCRKQLNSQEAQGGWLFTIHHEILKQVLADYMEELGVTVQYHSMVVDALCDDGRLRGVITESKSGREAILARVVIDASGDGDVAARAGVGFDLGRAGDHACQPATLMFRIGGVDYERAIFPGSFECQVQVPAGEIQALAREFLPAPAGHTLLYRTWLPGEVCVNMTNVIGIDGTDVRSLTQAEKLCRKQMPLIVDFLRRYAPGYEQCYPVSSAAVVGIRETRHFHTHYTLNEEDIVEGRLFDDWISTGNAFNFDIHNIEGAGLDKDGAQKHFKSKGRYSVPYGSCLPKGIDGLLLAGRCIGGTHKAHSNFRAMPICLGIGQGAGAAAAVAVAKDQSLQKLDIAAVQQELKRQGVPSHN